MKIIDFSKQLNCYFLILNVREIMTPNINALNKAILNSNAARFVEEPKKFFDEAS
jgi:hypothetical protein